MSARYVDVVGPGAGGLPPRAWHPDSDAAVLSLNGNWRFRISPTADTHDASFATPGHDTADWAEATVPGHWVLQGHGTPIYTNHRYPFPVDPPYVPTENPTGDHLRTFDLPADWPANGERPYRWCRGPPRPRGRTTGCWPPTANGCRCASASARSPSRTACSRSTATRSSSAASTGTSGLRLDVWRAPTDNDNGAHWQPDTRFGPLWRQEGLHRMRHRLDGVETDGAALTVRTRVAAAGGGAGLRTVYRWTSDGTRLRLHVSVAPDGEWPVPLPRLGIRLGLSGALDAVRWFGGGPGEGYPDTKAASLLGLWHADVAALQTPYVRPQENGARADVRWAEVGGLRVTGEPDF